SKIINNFSAEKKDPGQFKIKASSENVFAIEALDGQLITNKIAVKAIYNKGFCDADIENDILKIAVVNRYNKAPVAVAFIKNTGLKNGAIASCVAHDCHNIVAVGTNDKDICTAVNLIIENKGGISLANSIEKMILPLPIAGIMSNENAYDIAENYIAIDKKAKELGSKLRAPYMSLSFMALLVIPKLKLSDKGLFNGEDFSFVNVFCGETGSAKSL
ncbi:MAG: adenine deaminase, partial [Bacteroidia bacterium]|nr:adenine deaminase [Bacteroidia bacterium]